MSERERILQFALTIFLKEGIYKTSMDQIAREMRISKKTIYKYFPSKNEMVNKATQQLMSQIRGSIFEIVQSDTSSIEKMNGVLKVLVTLGLRVSDTWIKDLEIHYPNIWNDVNEMRNQAILIVFSQIFSQGQKEKFFKEYPIDIIITAFRSVINGIVNPAFLINSNFSIHEAARISFEIILNGILTEQGRNFYMQLKEEDKI
jgi:AcrR family transcriptional regulator